jgi:hypothetical protein
LNDFRNYLSKIATINTEQTIGSFGRRIQSVWDGRNRYHEIQPAYYQLDININNSNKIIIFRKGYGQYALYELENDSLNCFYHRGDSTGEGGSNVFYLGNRDSRHGPIARLFDRLLLKLTDKALIVTDGSNSDFGVLKEFYSTIRNLGKDIVVEKSKNKTISIGGAVLRCVDVLDYRYNHTLVWEVSKK